MRRRLLMAAKKAESGGEVLPPESTEFEFPLYLNTQVIEHTTDYLERVRRMDDILQSLFDFWEDNVDVNDDGVGSNDGWVPSDILNTYPVYIDGYVVTEAEYDGYGTFVITTGRDYGSFDNLDIGLDEYELFIVGYND